MYEYNACKKKSKSVDKVGTGTQHNNIEMH